MTCTPNNGHRFTGYRSKVINSYEGALTAKSIENLHVQLTKIAGWLLPWPIMLFGLLVGNIWHNLRKSGSETEVSPQKSDQKQ